jgi:glucose/mannose-6-phosphate isomerase
VTHPSFQPLSDPEALDDPAAIEAADPGDMLRAVASSGAQIREAVANADEAGIPALRGEGRPRAVVVLGMGGSGIAGDVLAALVGPRAPVPLCTVRDYTLPTWVGAADLVLAVSCSGRTEETLATFAEAARRGARLVAVGGANSPLADLAKNARAIFVPAPGGRQPRASLWSLAVPLLCVANALDLLAIYPDAFEAAARRLEERAQQCRPGSEAFVNPAKSLALALHGAIPVVWGTNSVSAVTALRFACQLNENAKTPAVSGSLPEAAHNQVVALDGPFGAGAASDATLDLFRDRVDEPAPVRQAVVLVRDRIGEHAQVARRAEVVRGLVEARGVPLQEIEAEGEEPIERLASLVGLIDFASVYLGLLNGVDPTPVAAIDELKARVAVPG